MIHHLEYYPSHISEKEMVHTSETQEKVGTFASTVSFQKMVGIYIFSA